MSDAPSPSRATSFTDLAIRCLDLTSLEGDETKEQVLELCERALRPDPEDASIPSVAAVVLYPSLVSVAASRLEGTGVRVASVAGFPAAEGPLEERLAEIRRASPGSRTVVVATDSDARWLGTALDAGASAVIPGGPSAQALGTVLQEVLGSEKAGAAPLAQAA